MPTSNPEGKPYILQYLIDHEEINTFVDFGAGHGTYAHLIKGLMPKKTMIGIDIWQDNIDYLNEKKLYDIVKKGDIRDIKLPPADCAILGDIIEHFEKEEAKLVFNRINHAYKHVILSMPPVDTLHGPECGNPDEAHKSLWTVEEIYNMCGKDYEIKIYTPPLVVCIK